MTTLCRLLEIIVAARPRIPVKVDRRTQHDLRLCPPIFSANLGADDNVADNEKSREYLRVKRMIAASKGGGLTVGNISKRVRGSMDINRLESVIGQLQISGEIILAAQPGERGQTRLRYWAKEHLPKDATQPGKA